MRILKQYGPQLIFSITFSLYIGATTDLKQRYQDHQNGQACRNTKLDPPVKVVYSESLPTFSDARKREAQIKRLGLFIFGDF